MQNITAHEVAKYIIYKANQEPEPDITNLKLQKLLYYAQGEHFANTGQPLFADDFEAWAFGPVIRSEYSRYCDFSNRVLPIPEKDTLELPVTTLSFLDEIVARYGKYSASYLVTKTHAELPFKKNFKNSGKFLIPKEDIKLFFCKEREKEYLIEWNKNAKMVNSLEISEEEFDDIVETKEEPVINENLKNLFEQYERGELGVRPT